MAKYTVHLRNGATRIVEAQDVQVSPQGSVKFLNGKKQDAKLVAYFNTADVISVEEMPNG